MKPEFIKPIPKYITDKIRRLDKKHCPDQKGRSRMYSYLTTVKKELVKITVAVVSRYGKWLIKQVAVHGVKSTECLAKDIKFTHIGGYSVGWHAEGLYREPYWYEDGLWYPGDYKYFNPWTTLVNPEYVGRFPEYQYSAYQNFMGRCIIEYLRLYEQYPQTEFLIKLGFHKLHNSILVLKQIAVDKAFCKWLITHKDEIKHGYVNIGTIMQAYKTKKPIKDIQAFEEFKKDFCDGVEYKPIRKTFRGKELYHLKDYINGQEISINSYLDYFNACKFIKLDMKLPKNRYPHDFKKWHDIRIDEYHTAKALADEKERADFYKKFAAIAEKYLALQNVEKADYAVFIAHSPTELFFEGKILNHCVGKMDYEQKFMREETLIFFVRDAEKPNVPFVTVEYSLKQKRILQCYGLDSKRPDDTVLDFVNNKWLPHANKTIQKMKKAA